MREGLGLTGSVAKKYILHSRNNYIPFTLKKKLYRQMIWLIRSNYNNLIFIKEIDRQDSIKKKTTCASGLQWVKHRQFNLK